MSAPQTTIASVSLAQPLESIADAMGRSFQNYGFAIIRDHGIPQELIDQAEYVSKAFFALPDDVKRAYQIAGGGGARGYTPFGTEKAKDAEVHDLKEFWHVGRELPADDPLAEYMAPNIWPSEIADFEATFSALYDAFDAAGLKVLEAIALHLGLDQHFFAPTLDRLTNSRLKSTTHRVVNPAGDAAQRSRYSMPFFLHFRPDYVIETLECCIEKGGAASRDQSGLRGRLSRVEQIAGQLLAHIQINARAQRPFKCGGPFAQFAFAKHARCACQLVNQSRQLIALLTG